MGIQNDQIDGRDVVLGGLACEITDPPTEYCGISALLEGKADMGGGGFGDRRKAR